MKKENATDFHHEDTKEMQKRNDADLRPYVLLGFASCLRAFVVKGTGPDRAIFTESGIFWGGCACNLGKIAQNWPVSGPVCGQARVT